MNTDAKLFKGQQLADAAAWRSSQEVQKWKVSIASLGLSRRGSYTSTCSRVAVTELEIVCQSDWY
jgi:hypothetical protein